MVLSDPDDCGYYGVRDAKNVIVCADATEEVAEAIAHAPEDIAALLADLDAAEAALEETQAEAGIRLAELWAERNALRARCEAAEAIVRPFAEQTCENLATERNDANDGWIFTSCGECRVCRARAFLATEYRKREAMSDPSLAYVCAVAGHVQHGSGTGTTTLVWATYCARCGANLSTESEKP